MLTFTRGKQLRRQIKKWGWERRQQESGSSIRHDEVLISKVELLWRKNFTHKKILRALNEFEGYSNLSSRQLKRLRLQYGFLRASRSDEQKQIPLEAARQEVRNQLTIGQSTRYGQVNAWTNVRRFGSVFISRNTISAVTREIDPEGVAFRRADKLRKRGRYVVKGPNRVWSVDGH